MVATQYLMELGSSRIGFIVSQPHLARTGHRWLGGYLPPLGKLKPSVYAGKQEADKMRKWMRSNKVNGLITINRHAWDSRPSSDIPVVFLNSFDCPDEVPRIVYDPQKSALRESVYSTTCT